MSKRRNDKRVNEEIIKKVRLTLMKMLVERK